MAKPVKPRLICYEQYRHSQSLYFQPVPEHAVIRDADSHSLHLLSVVNLHSNQVAYGILFLLWH